MTKRWTAAVVAGALALVVTAVAAAPAPATNLLPTYADDYEKMQQLARLALRATVRIDNMIESRWSRGLVVDVTQDVADIEAQATRLITRMGPTHRQYAIAFWAHRWTVVSRSFAVQLCSSYQWATTWPWSIFYGEPDRLHQGWRESMLSASVNPGRHPLHLLPVTYDYTGPRTEDSCG